MSVLSCWGAPTETKKFIFLTLLTLAFSRKKQKTNDPEDFLSFAKIQFKVQQDGCTVSKMFIGRALTKLGFEAKPKKISGRTVVGRTCIKERGEEE